MSDSRGRLGLKNQLIITGFEGFIGKEFIKKSSLLHKYKITLCKKPSELKKIIFDYPSSIIVHLAGKFSGSKDEVWNSNVELTRELVNNIRYMKEGCLIYLSTGAVYGQELNSKPAIETDTIRPTTHYGLTKAKAEIIIQNNVQSNGNKYFILRLPNVYGGTQKKGVIYFFQKQIKDNNEITISGKGSQIRDYLHINDLIRAIDLSITSHSKSNIFNISSKLRLDVNQVADILCNKNTKRKYILETNYLEKLILDYSKATRVLGYEPTINQLLIE